MMQMAVTAADEELQVWQVPVGVELDRAGRAVTDPDVEPLLELMLRTRGVRYAAAVPHESSIDIAVALAAPGAGAARDRARALVASCARYAGLGPVTAITAAMAVPVDGRVPEEPALEGPFGPGRTASTA